MIGISVMQILRRRHSVSAAELAAAIGVSQQHVSAIELGVYSERYNYERTCLPMVQKAFEAVIESRGAEASQLAVDYAALRDYLLFFGKEMNHEL